MSKRFCLVVSILCAIGCNSNPYAKVSGPFSDHPPQAKPVDGNLEILVDGTSEIPEGQTTSVSLTGTVLSGTPVFTFKDLPGWVVYNPATKTLDCTPPPGTGVGPDPQYPYAVFKFDVNMVSSLTPSTIKTAHVSLIVRHAAQGIQLGGFDSQAKILEGQAYQSSFSVNSLDFPKGRFIVSATNVPAGVTITASSFDPSVFVVTYDPAFNNVTTNNTTNTCNDSNFKPHLCATLNWTLNVVDPRGAISTQQAQWTILDQRQDVKVIVPTGLRAYTKGTETTMTADFQIPVEDMNGETIPQVSADTPMYGYVSVTSASSSGPSSGSNPYNLVHVVWTGVPSSAQGSTQSFNLRTCVNDYTGYPSQCTTTPVSVQF